MELWEVLLIGVALAMDAFAVGATDGMAEPRMKGGKMVLIAATFGIFQAAMPILGYYAGYAFSEVIAKIAPWLSFALLAIIGGKAVLGFFFGKKEEESHPVRAGGLLVQGLATSLDALAVGVTLLAAETAKGLPMHVTLCALVIGAVTFALVVPAVLLGKKVGNRFSDKAELLGGLVLLAIGIKILLEGIL